MRSPTRVWLIRLNLLAATSLGTVSLYTFYTQTSSSNGSPKALNKASFTPYTLISREKVSNTSTILRLRAPKGLSQADKDAEEKWKACLWRKGIWSVEIKQPQLMIARRYTPLPSFEAGFARDEATSSNTDVLTRPTPTPSPASGSAEIEELSILLRREPHGEVSRYLDSLPLNSAVEVRGGFKEYNIHADVRDVVFLAGGTGIAPALQAARCLQERADSRLTILWANRLRVDCIGGANAEVKEKAALWGLLRWLSWSGAPVPAVQLLPTGEKSLIVRQLDALSARSGHEVAEQGTGLSLRARYFVDEEMSLIQQKDLVRALTSNDEDGKAATDRRKLIIVSGPDGFVKYVAGAKKLVNGIETQGELGGLLSKVDLHGWEVHKL